MKEIILLMHINERYIWFNGQREDMTQVEVNKLESDIKWLDRIRVLRARKYMKQRKWQWKNRNSEQ